MDRPNLRVELSREEDIPRLTQLIVPAFESNQYSQLVGDTMDNIAAVRPRHLHAWKEHAKISDVPFAIKCVHTNEAGEETIIASAYWIVYDRERTEEEYLKPTYLSSAAWVEDVTKREEALAMTESKAILLRKWFGGKPYAYLLFMVTDPSYRRMGAATMCVKWGLEQCSKIGVPAYLIASDDGVPVYSKLGYEVVDSLKTIGDDGTPAAYPAMIRWPPQFDEKDKKPVLPNYGSSTR